MNAALRHPRPPSRPSIDFSHINRIAGRSSGPLAPTGRNLRSVHDAINGLLPGAEKMSHSAAKAMTRRDGQGRSVACLEGKLEPAIGHVVKNPDDPSRD